MVSTDDQPTSASAFTPCLREGQNDIDLKTKLDIAGVMVLGSKLAREITELVRDTETPCSFTTRAASTTGALSRAIVANSNSTSGDDFVATDIPGFDEIPCPLTIR